MSEVLEVLISMTIGSWITALFILVLRLVFHRVLSPRAKYLLWLLLALRLCLPVLPESQLSLMNAAPVRSAAQTVTQFTAKPEPAPSPLLDAESPEMTPSESVESTRNWEQILLIVWATGAGVCLGVYGLLLLRTHHSLQSAVFVDDPEAVRKLLLVRSALGVTKPIRLCCGSETLIGGLITPTLLISRELSGDQLEAALTHELMHYKSGDLWITALQRLLCCFHWFNPACWLCFRQARLDCEMACDQRVLEETGVSPAVYAELLYQEGKMTRRYRAGTTAFGRSDLKDRIRNIAANRRTATWMTALAVVIAAIVAVCTLTQPKTSEDSAESTSGYVHGYIDFSFTNTDSRGVTFTSPGEQFVVKYRLKPVDAEIRWASTDESVATIDQYGVMTAVGPGTCDITATVGMTTAEGQVWDSYSERSFTVYCEFVVSDLSVAGEPLSVLLEVRDQELLDSFSLILVEKSQDPVRRVLKDRMGNRITEAFSNYFSSGTGIGKLWSYANYYGFTATCKELKITDDHVNRSRYDYEATLSITDPAGVAQDVSFYGVVRFNSENKVTSITAESRELSAFYQYLEEEFPQ